MTECPACGAENPDDAAACHRCHLASGLFEPVREAVNLPSSDPMYLQAIGEVLAAMDSEPRGEPRENLSGPGALSYPSRFPAPPAPVRAARERVPPPPAELPALPALPAGAELPALRHQIEELLAVARRRGVDLSSFSERIKSAVLTEDRDALERVSRELFVFLAAQLTEELEIQLGGRNEIAEIVGVDEVDPMLAECERTLRAGALPEADAHLRRASDLLTELEEEWATVQVLILEAELLAETIRELGGDPAPALGPLEEGRRLARDRRREEAEPILARANLALWQLLGPILSPKLLELRDRIEAMRSGGQDVIAVSRDLRDLLANLRHRNFGAAITAYRRIRGAVLPASAAPSPS